MIETEDNMEVGAVADKEFQGEDGYSEKFQETEKIE